MGQYYYIVNLDKKQFLHPHKFGDGLKLLAFGSSGSGTMCGLAILLANSNGRGGGDLHSEHPIIGTWAGDRIVIAGDYAEMGDPCEVGENIYSRCGGDSSEYTDISAEVIEAMCDDSMLLNDLVARAAWGPSKETMARIAKSHANVASLIKAVEHNRNQQQTQQA